MISALLLRWREAQRTRKNSEKAREWRAGYDLAAGHLLRDGQPERVLALIDLAPRVFDAGIRCAVRDYHTRLAQAAQHRMSAVH